MSYVMYEIRLFIKDNLIKFVIILLLLLCFLLLISKIFASEGKKQFKKYISYETSFNKKQEIIISKLEVYSKEYYENKRSKKQYISNLKSSAEDMEKLYNAFSWNKGDEVTKELYIIKKQIMLNYIQIYINKATAIEKDVDYTEFENMTFITSLLERYIQKDRYQRQRYNIKFVN